MVGIDPGHGVRFAGHGGEAAALFDLAVLLSVDRIQIDRSGAEIGADRAIGTDDNEMVVFL